MTKKQINNQAGFSHVLLLALGVVVIGFIGFVGFKVAHKSNGQANNTVRNQSSGASTSTNTATTASARTWNYINDTWKSTSANPPSCPSPLLSVSPVDVGKATAVLYPGQVRGIYKAHGGFLFGNDTTSSEPARLSMDTQIIDGSRYIQTGQVQYMFDFIAPCGIRLRYDHLLTLSPAFQKIADTFPQPKVNDSTTTDITNGKSFKAGETIATQIGFPAPNFNVTMDFGVYDMRQPNAASKRTDYAVAHKTSGNVDFYAICWLPDLPGKDAALAASLPGGDGVMGKTSDYCK